MPQLPRRRRSIRLRDYDYRTPAAYFVTICTHDGRLLLADPALRHLVEDTWASLPDHHGVTADVFVVMPNHIHGILSIWGQVGAQRAAPLRPVLVEEAFRHALHAAELAPFPVTERHRAKEPPISRPDLVGAQRAAPLRPGFSGRPVQPGSLSAIVRSFKSASTKAINDLQGTRGSTIWQRNYYEHIIRDERELGRVRDYIANNPANWRYDRDNPLREISAEYEKAWSWIERRPPAL